jgi:hypothetical protein
MVNKNNPVEEEEDRNHLMLKGKTERWNEYELPSQLHLIKDGIEGSQRLTSR